MKNKIISSVLTLALLLTAMPAAAQNYLKLYFKDGHTERHFMHLVQNITASKYDLEGNLHSDYQIQQIVMPDTTYSYYIADIDSMAFTKVNDQKVISDIKTTATFVESKLQQYDITEMESSLSEIKSLDGVQDAYIEESNLIVDIVDWGSLCYHLSHDSDSDLPDLAVNSKAIRCRSAQKVWPIKCYNNVKVALLNQQSNDLSREHYKRMLQIQEEFNAMGFDAHYIPSEDLTVNFFLDDVFQYDIVYLNTHGFYTKRKHWFMTGEELSIGKLPAEAESNFLQYTFNLDVDIDGIMYSHAAPEQRNPNTEEKVNVYYKAISEEVIANSKNHFEKGHNTIFFNAACQSMKKNDSMAKIYTEGKFADVYFGYDDDSHTTKDLLAAKNIFEYMLNGYSLEAAMRRLNEEHNITDPNHVFHLEDLIDQYNIINNEKGGIVREWIAHLKEVDASDYTKLFIVKTFTEESQMQKINEEYISNGNATLKGITSIADKEAKSNLKCGFSYGPDPTLLISYNKIFCDNLEYIENENGNVSFSCLISDIQSGQTYYYRAFTYDGLHYNFGEVKSFKIEEQRKCPARITGVELTSAEYHHDRELPNELHYVVKAKLDDPTGVEEWGVYYEGATETRTGYLEFPFAEVAGEQSDSLYYNGGNSWSCIDLSSFVAELSDKAGVYVKSRNSATGELETLYSDLFSYTLRYDKKPSYTFSNPTITGTEVIKTSGSKKQYKTSTSYHYVIEGGFWIENIISEVSGDGWEMSGSNDPWYPIKDQEDDGTWSNTYWSNSNNLNHTSWKLLRLRNSESIKSNYLNWSGSNLITEVWTSSSPAYSRQKRASVSPQISANGELNMLSIEEPIPQNGLENGVAKFRKEYPYKDCMIGIETSRDRFK